MQNHAEELNAQQSSNSNRNIGLKVNKKILTDIFDEQKQINIYVIDCRCDGAGICFGRP